MTTTPSDFDEFIDGPIRKGDATAAVRMWRGTYVRARRLGGTALHWACMGYTCVDREGVVRVLLARGCDTEAEADSDYGWGWRAGWRPLQVCALTGNRGAMRALLEAEGCRLTAVTPQGETPLQIAETWKHHECVSMLRTAIQIRGLRGDPTVSDDTGLGGAGGGSVLKTLNKEVSDPIELLKNNSLSKIVELDTGKTLLDKLLNCKDQKALEAIKVRQVDDQEISELKSLQLNKVDPKSLQSLHECLVYRCIHQKYDCAVYSLCTANIVNKSSLFMGPTALETAVDCGAVVWVHEILRKLTKVDGNQMIILTLLKNGLFLFLLRLNSTNGQEMY